MLVRKTDREKKKARHRDYGRMLCEGVQVDDGSDGIKERLPGAEDVCEAEAMTQVDASY